MRSSLQLLCAIALGLLASWGEFSSFSIAGEATSEEITLWPGVAPGSEGYQHEEENNGEWIRKVSRPTLTLYIPDAEKRCGSAIVICPGGGYGGLSIQKEGHALAKWCRDRGMVAGVLKYRHGGGQHQQPVPLNDAQRALRIIRSRAADWQINPDQIGIAGFSAGGHLAATAGTRFDKGDSESEDPIEQASCRANFMVLVYPVISMQAGVTHNGSRENLLGKSPNEELVNSYSNELQVSAETAPAFLVHASDDGVVHVDNPLLFYKALHKKNVPAELHVYANGGHGFGLLRGDKPWDRWPEFLEAWLKGRQLIK